MRITQFLLPAALLLTACGAPRPVATTPQPMANRDPSTLVTLLANTSTPEDSRKHADALLVQQKGKTDPARLAVLEQILYAPGHSDAMRIYAMEQLADADPANAGRALELYLPKFAGENNAVLAHACDLAVQLGDERLVGALTRSLDRITNTTHDSPPDISARPEWPTLEKLAAKPQPEIFFTLIQSSTNLSTRIAALDILSRITPNEETVSRIQKMNAHDAWLLDLQWWTRLFAVPPLGPSESIWMQYLHRPEFAPLLSRAAERHHLLSTGTDKAHYLFAPRFVTVLAYMQDAETKLTAADLRARLQPRLAALPHIQRTPQYEHAPDDIPETLDPNRSKLTLCDLLAIRLLLDALQDHDGANIAQLHQQGLDDLSDTATEHGGLLAFQNVDNPQLLITLYPPYYASNDFEYVSSDKLLQETAAGLAQYHFHFQQIHNAERAGPGSGDLTYVHTQRCNAVVVTSVDTRKIDIDYYTPSGAVIDLGIYDVK